MQATEAQANPYKPHLLRIRGVRTETPDVRTLTMGFVEAAAAHGFPGWEPGQFGEFTVFGFGESVFAISNAPWRRSTASDTEPVIECTFRDIGKVTHALRSCSVGDVVGFRGPYGNSFPVDTWRGKDIAFIGGGIGMAAIRSAILDVLQRRDEFGDIVILNGARTVPDMVYQEQMAGWAKRRVRVVRTVDPGGESPDWDGEVGLIPQVFEKIDVKPEGRVVVACGPPVMLQFLFVALAKMRFSPDQVITTLENKMKCGIGICGRCNVGPFYVCRDGPVLTWEALRKLPRDL